MKPKLLFTVLTFIAMISFSQNATFQEKIITPGNDLSSAFGLSVDIKGDLLVGGDTSDPNGTVASTGAAFIYRKDNNGNFIFEQKLKAPFLESGDSYAIDVAINGDFIAVGAYRYEFADTVNGFPKVDDAGAVFLYKYNTNTNQWNLVNQIFAPTRLSNHNFGWRVLLTDNQVFVSEWFHRNTNVNASRAGKVHIYDYDSNGNVTYNQGIDNPEPDSSDLFGSEIALSGNTLAVGANGEDFDQNNNNQLSNAGAVYMFEKDGNGVYNLQQKIVSNTRVSFANFGDGLDLDGNTLLVGATNETRMPSGTTNTLSCGIAYVFKYDGTTWSQTALIEPPTIENNANFGSSINIEENTVLIGYEGGRVPFNGSTISSGLVEQITLDNSGQVTNRFTIAPPFPETTNEFGYITAWDGNQLAVGAYADRGDINGNILDESPGAVYVYALDNALSNTTFLRNTAFSVYPNPASDFLSIKTNATISLKTVTIYTQDGRLVKHVVNPNESIPISDLQSGLYLLGFTSENNTQTTLKFIKN